MLTFTAVLFSKILVIYSCHAVQTTGCDPIALKNEINNKIRTLPSDPTQQRRRTLAQARAELPEASRANFDEWVVGMRKTGMTEGTIERFLGALQKQCALR